MYKTTVMAPAHHPSNVTARKDAIRPARTMFQDPVQAEQFSLCDPSSDIRFVESNPSDETSPLSACILPRHGLWVRAALLSTWRRMPIRYDHPDGKRSTIAIARATTVAILLTRRLRLSIQNAGSWASAPG